MNYYNEHDPKAAAWLRELITQGLIPPGHVDTRSIAEIQPHDLSAYTQCHFFAGIGGWSLALQLAGWPTDRPVWTGSCPCQPFSVAGKGLGEADERHLWPAFHWLIAQCRPPVVFGEQVASAAGREWLAGIRADLEGLGYEVGAADLCAASAGAPHIRQRIFWVADANSNRLSASPRGEFHHTKYNSKPRREFCGLGDTNDARSQRHRGLVELYGESGREVEKRHGSTAGFWGDFDILPCTDGKARRVESGTFPLAHGVPGRVGLLRGYGNAIVPQVAAQFIQACEECIA